MNQKVQPIRGSIVALVTPMHNDGSLDLPALRELVDWHVASGTANVMPRAMAALCDAALDGDATMVRAMQLEWVELHHALFAEANPIPVKWLLARTGATLPIGIWRHRGGQ
jgi:dihydrodipicolinate synthase/N-acetylneuraminate lyase